jgi:hypothetical protein
MRLGHKRFYPVTPRRHSHRTEASIESDGVNSSPAIADRVVYIAADDGKIYALNAYSGDELWSYKIQSEFDDLGTRIRFYSSPAIAYGNIYIITMDHFVTVLGPSSPRIISGQDLLVIIVVVLAATLPLIASLVWKRHKNRRYYAGASIG